MNILTGILMFFKKAFSKEYIIFTLIVIIALLVFTSLNYRTKYKAEIGLREQQAMIYEQNLFALEDTITKVINKKLGTIEYDKAAFLTSIENLARYDESLSRKLEGISGEILNAIDGIAIGTLPPAEVDNDLIDYGDGDNSGDGEYGLGWAFNYQDSGLIQKLTGESRFKLYKNGLFPGITTIDTNYFNVNLTYGFKEEDDRYKVWAVSKSPYVEISELTGAYFIDKAPIIGAAMGDRSFVFGPYIGYGVNFDNIFHNSRLGWNFGLSLQYNIFGFGKRKTKSVKSSNKNYEKTVDKILGTTNLKQHRVENAETVYSISTMYGMTTNQLKKINNLNSDYIEIGQVLLVSNNY